MAITNLEQFFTGRQILHARITPLTVAPLTGLITKGTSRDLATAVTVENISFEGTVDDVEISAANALMRSYTNVKDDFQVTVEEIKANDGTTAIINAWVGSDYFLAEAVMSPDAGTTTTLTVQAVCKRRSFRTTFSEGKQTDTLVGVPCGYPMAFIPAGGTLTY